MSKVLEVINSYKKTIENEPSFKTGVYFYKKNKLNIDEGYFNQHCKLIKETFLEKYNSEIDIEVDNVYLFMFKRQRFSHNRYQDYFVLFLEDGIITFMHRPNNDDSSKSLKLLDIIIPENVGNVELVYKKNELLTGFLFNFIELQKDRGVFSAYNFCCKTYKDCKLIVGLINDIVNISNQEITNDIELLQKFYKEEKYDEILNSTSLKNNNNSTIAYYYHFFRTVAYEGLGEKENMLNEALDLKRSYDTNEWEYDLDLTSLLANVYEENGDNLNAIKWFSYTLDSDKINLENEEDEQVKRAEVSLLKSYEKFKEDFTTIPVQKRKYIFITDQLLHTEMDSLVVLKNDDLPKNIHFPLTHPHLNEVYTCHPISVNSYIPLKDFKDALFLDKLREFKFLMDGLGAKKIEIVNRNSTIDTTEQKTKTDVAVKASYKGIGADVNYGKLNEEDHQLEQELNFLFNQELSPRKMPYVPEGVVWYQTDINWQRLVQQRMNGSLISHRELISSKKIENLSSHELNKVNVALGILFAKVSVDYQKDTYIKSTSEKHYSLELKVEFEDIDILKQKDTDRNNMEIESPDTKIKQEGIERYREEVQFMLEDDGIIDESERRILDREIEKYGLTKEQALKIEQDSMFNSNEVKYLEEYKLMLSEGEITEVEQRMLDRYAKRYKITKEKQEILEQSLKS